MTLSLKPLLLVQAQVMLRNQMIQLVLGTDMKQHFPTCGLFASTVKSKALAAAAAATMISRTSDDDRAGVTTGITTIDHAEPLSRVQLDEEAQLLVWKVWPSTIHNEPYKHLHLHALYLI
jgi:hypothetical protein